MIDIFTVLGLLGALMIFVGYLFITYEVVSTHTYTYVALNFIGAVLLAIDATMKQAYSALTINCLFIAASFILLMNTVKKNNLSKGKFKKR